MSRARTLIALVLGGAALAALPPAAVGAAAAPAADEDLLCALWTAGLVDEAPDDVKAGLSRIMTFFLGRYEAASGRPFERKRDLSAT